MTDQGNSKVIESFVLNYHTKYDFFDKSARLAARFLEERLSAAGIRSMVTSRAKSVRSLEPKVRERAPRKSYHSEDDIFDDIVDLAGVRIAIYFPGEYMQIDNIIKDLFDLVEDPRTFPDPSTIPRYKKRFSGYWATHYRVRLKKDILSDEQKRFGEARIEIQVASVLMHAWSEVEHDLVYKPQQGGLSEEEYAILDELNGMVLAGEIALELLQKAGKARIATGGLPFKNHYDLASHLLSVFEPKATGPIKETALGGIDLLYELLNHLNLRSPNQLKPYLQSLSFDLEKRPLADQIIDQILSEDAGRYQMYEKLRADRSSANSYLGRNHEEAGSEIQKEIGKFLQVWSTFENEINDITAKRNMPHLYLSGTLLSRLGIVDEPLLREFEKTRQLRNELVHGFPIPSLEDIRSATDKLFKIRNQIKNRM